LVNRPEDEPTRKDITRPPTPYQDLAQQDQIITIVIVFLLLVLNFAILNKKKTTAYILPCWLVLWSIDQNYVNTKIYKIC
jgi:hypothetical protein